MSSDETFHSRAAHNQEQVDAIFKKDSHPESKNLAKGLTCTWWDTIEMPLNDESVLNHLTKFPDGDGPLKAHLIT